jgi:hypothetical protein
MPRLGLGLGLGRYPGGAWSPTALPGLLSLWDWQSPIFGELGRTTTPTADAARVYWIDDREATRNLQVASITQRTYLRPAIGPSAGKRSLEWDGTNAQSMYFATGSELLSGSAFTMVAVFNPSAAGAISGIMGRGGYNGTGVYLRMNAANRLEGVVTTAGATTVTEPDATTAAWKVAGLTYDGSNMRLAVRGKVTQSSAKTGAMSFHASDTAFWLGACTGNGAAWAWAPQKYLALALVTTDTYSAAGLEALLNQVAGYAGIA